MRGTKSAEDNYDVDQSEYDDSGKDEDTETVEKKRTLTIILL